MMETEQQVPKSQKVLTVFVIIAMGVIVAIAIIAVLIAAHGPAILSREQKQQYVVKYEKDIEPVIANSDFSKQMLMNNPDQLAQYMHITDVLYGTTLCNGVPEDKLVKQLQADPILVTNYSARYFEYLDEKYN